MRIISNHLSRIMRKGGTISNKGCFYSKYLITIHNTRWNSHQLIMMLTYKKLHKFLIGFRALPMVIQNKLNHAFNDRIKLRLLSMFMPSLDYSGIGHRKINFSKFFKMRIIRSQHVHNYTPLITDFFKRMYQNAFDHSQKRS